MDEKRLEKLLRYLEVLSKIYFTDDPLNVKPSVEKVMLLIEMEFNRSFDGEELLK